MLRIDPSRQGAKFLRRLPPKPARQVATKTTRLGEDPNPPDSIPLKGKVATYRRADVGEYRIVYRVAGDALEIVLIGKRNDADVYRMLKRLPK